MVAYGCDLSGSDEGEGKRVEASEVHTVQPESDPVFREELCWPRNKVQDTRATSRTAILWKLGATGRLARTDCSPSGAIVMMKTIWPQLWIGILSLACLASQGCTSCQVTVMKEYPSPTGEWKAGLLASVCGTAHGYYVGVVPRDQHLVPLESTAILALNFLVPCCIDVEAPENADLVQLAWRDDRLLWVSYPQSLKPYAKIRPQIGEVHVDIEPVETRLEAELGTRQPVSQSGPTPPQEREP